MHSYPPCLSAHDHDRMQFGAHMSQFVQPGFDSQWTSVDPALYQLHIEQQKQLQAEYSYFQHLQLSYHSPSSQIFEGPQYAAHFPNWTPNIDGYRHTRYDSPGGHFGGTLSESSSDYNVSPEIARQQIILNQNRYFSPPADTIYSQQSWTTDTSFQVTPATTPAASQTQSIAPRELEFQEAPECEFGLREDDLRTLPISVPEELELSDSIADLTRLDRTNTNTTISTQSHDDSDSSVSTPARDHDSDSDFDPKRRSSRTNVTHRNLPIRIPRRHSSSFPSTLDTNYRVHKQGNARPSINREKSTTKPLPKVDSSPLANPMAKSPRFFPCAFHAFGCHSTFGNKNEWKRHVTTQHLQLGFYRCDLGSCNPENATKLQVQQIHGFNQASRGRGHNKRRSISKSQITYDDDNEEIKIYNDFNRKDLFTQHCRRMHGPLRHLLDSTTQTNQAINARLRAQGRKITNITGRPMCTKDDENKFEEELDDIRVRCWTPCRNAPHRSNCGFCGKVFEASTYVSMNDMEGKAEERAWEERMEHVGRHYERDGSSPSMEGGDPDLLEWGLKEGILVEIEGVGAWLASYEVSSVKAEDEEQRRESLRRRGPRKKVPVVKMETDIKSGVRLSTTVKEEEDSDVDAMAEDF